MSNNKLYITIEDLIWYASALIGVICIFGDRISLGIPQFDSLRRILAYELLMMAAYMSLSYKSIINKKTAKFLTVFVLFVGGVYFSCIQNAGLIDGPSPLSNMKSDFAILSCIMIFLLYTAANDKMEQYFKVVGFCIAFLCIVNDILMILHITFGGSSGGLIYFIGTKFTISYLHMSLVVIYSIINRFSMDTRKRFIQWMLILATVIISIYVDCNTGTIGCLILALFLLSDMYLPTIKKLLYSNVFFSLTLFGGLLFVALIISILSNSYVQHIIVDVLDRELTLTGRTDIYMILFPVLANRILYGYGYGNNYTVSTMIFGYANTQNGISEWIIQVGIIGVIPMIALFLFCISATYNTDKKKEMLPIVSIILVYNLLASVEITISLGYIYWTLLLFGWTYWKNVTDNTSKEAK